MSREILFKKTVDTLSRLSDSKLQEVADFTEFLTSKVADNEITWGIQKLASESKAFEFLEQEEDIYTVNDLKEVYRK